MLVHRTTKYRLYPTRSQEAKVETVRQVCREMYNAAIYEREDAWKVEKKSISKYDQNYQVKFIRQTCPEVRELYASIVYEVLNRVEDAYKTFFRKKKGRPRYRSENSYKSFTYTQGEGFRLEGKYLKLSKIGNVKCKVHRKLEGKYKTCTIKNENGIWYAFIVQEVEVQDLPKLELNVGIDLGFEKLATLSDGKIVENKRFLENEQRKLRVLRKKVERRPKKDSKRRKKAKLQVAKLHKIIHNRREDFLHKESTKIVSSYQTIIVGNLNVRNLKLGFIGKSCSSAALSSFVNKIAYKAESAGRIFKKVDERGSTQLCSSCGKLVPKKWEDRIHSCPSCGLVLDRDENSARNLLRKGLEQLNRSRIKLSIPLSRVKLSIPPPARTAPSGANVEVVNSSVA
jgi:putative transposase